MTSMLKYAVLLISTLLLIGCLDEVESSYKLPRKVTLSTNFIAEPLFIGEILDHPIKHGDIWNDSIIKLLEVDEIQIDCKGGVSPESTNKRMSYSFTPKGKAKRFEFFDYEMGEDPYSSFEFRRPEKNKENIFVSLYYGEQDTIELNKYKVDELDVMVRKDHSALNDSIIVYHPSKNTKVIIEKIGSKISMLQVVTPKNTSIAKAQKMVSSLGITKTDLNYAECKITYTKTGLPVSTYMLSREWRQQSMLEEWKYFEDRVVVNYKKYVNHTLVRNYNFSYSEDLVLRTIEQDGKIYEFNYH